MKRIEAIGMLMMTVLASTSAFAETGGDSGNGGGGIVCLQPNGTRTVRLLDLREAEQNPGLNVRRSTTPWPQQLEAALRKYSAVQSSLVTLMRKELDYMSVNTLDAVKRLPPPADTQIQELDEPRNCFLEGVANFDDATGKLSIDKELDELMSETDRAALRFHEALYRVQRTLISSTNNSKAARAITGRVFATEPLIARPVDSGLAGAKSKCVSEDQRYVFFVVPQAKGAELVFTRMNGMSLDERTSIHVAGNENVPGKYKVEGDVLRPLERGYLESRRAPTKMEKKRAGMGTMNLSFNHFHGMVTSQFGLPMKVVVASGDIGSNQGYDAVVELSRSGPKSGWAASWGLKKATVYENVSNFVALNTPGSEAPYHPNFAKPDNSRFTCEGVNQ